MICKNKHGRFYFLLGTMDNGIVLYLEPWTKMEMRSPRPWWCAGSWVINSEIDSNGLQGDDLGSRKEALEPVRALVKSPLKRQSPFLLILFDIVNWFFFFFFGAWPRMTIVLDGKGVSLLVYLGK